jgi:predicted ribosome quality control (RQC) complex YloA/Tae2 family protein
MLTNYHTLKNLIVQIKPKLVHSQIVEAFTQEKDTLHIIIAGEEALALELNATGQGYIFLRSKFERARKNSLDIFPEIFGDEIRDVLIYKADRIIEILLSSGLKLIFQFFTGKVNFFLLNQKGEIIASFKNPKDNIGKIFESEKKDSNYDLMLSDFNAFKNVWESNEIENPVLRLVKSVDTIDMLTAREILHRAGELEAERIWKALVEVGAELKNPKARIYYEGSFPRYFSIIELTHINLRKVEFDDINEAIRRFVIETRVGKSYRDEKKAIETKLNELVEKRRRTIEKVVEEIENNQRAQQYEIFGSILMANLNLIEKGLEEVELVNVFSEKGEKIKIKLDPSLSPVENAQMYFEKAKKTRASLKIAQERLERLKFEIKQLENLLDELASCENFDALKKFKEKNLEELKKFGIVKDKIVEKIGGKFRRFIVDGGFEVWVGKDAKSNELLTFKFSDKEDLWFHARGTSGAHVVLKTGRRQPSKKAIEQAGSIAAYFSQARTSRLVPVVVTKRKYVRKPKGAPEGTVAVEREEVIMVEPKLPSEEIE